MDVRLDRQRDPGVRRDRQQPLQARRRLRQRLSPPLPRIDHARQHEDHADAGALAEAHRLLQVGDVLIEVPRDRRDCGRQASRRRDDRGREDRSRVLSTSSATRSGSAEKLRLVERRPVKIADVKRVDAERLRDACRLLQRAGRQRPRSERELERPSDLLHPAARGGAIHRIEHLDRAHAGLARRAVVRSSRPRQRSTSTRSGCVAGVARHRRALSAITSSLPSRRRSSSRSRSMSSRSMPSEPKMRRSICTGLTLRKRRGAGKRGRRTAGEAHHRRIVIVDAGRRLVRSARRLPAARDRRCGKAGRADARVGPSRSRRRLRIGPGRGRRAEHRAFRLHHRLSREEIVERIRHLQDDVLDPADPVASRRASSVQGLKFQP